MGGKQSFPRIQIPKDNISVVTGGNAGIGYHTAKWIAMMGGTVIIACRSEERATKAIEQMNDEFQEEKKKQTPGVVDYDKLNVEFMKLDCASFKSVMEFVEEYKASGRKLHKLYCNAGIGIQDSLSYTEDGHERVLQVNYISQFLMTSHLLPVMMNSGPDCRIVLVSSYGHNLAHFDISDIGGKKQCEPKFNSLELYTRSKLYQVMQMYKMNSILQNSNVTLFALDPGAVETDLLTTFNRGAMSIAIVFVRAIGYSKTPFQGAWTSLNAGLNPEFAGKRNIFFTDSKPSSHSSVSKRKPNQDAVLNYTMDCLKEYLPQDIVNLLQVYSAVNEYVVRQCWQYRMLAVSTEITAPAALQGVGMVLVGEAQ